MSVLHALADLLFPPSCAACGEGALSPFCGICRAALEPARSPRLAGIARVVVPYLYGGPIEDAVRALKYGRRPDLGRTLGACMKPSLNELGRVDLAVPIPTPPSRLRARGYNPARELCRGLSVPVGSRALRQLHERRQVGLDRRERLVNPAIRPGPGAHRVRGRRVVLIDDVVTTGATLEAAARQLRALGAGEVVGLCLARASSPGISANGEGRPP